MSKQSTLDALLRLAGNNPNEAEAMAAIDKAMMFAQKFGLSLEDARKRVEHGLDTKTDDYATSDPQWAGVDRLEPVDEFCSRFIAKFCCCRVWRDKTDSYIVVKFFGQESDVDLALFLRTTIKKAMRHDWAIRKWEKDFTAREVGNAKLSFMRGFADRVNERLEASQTRFETEEKTGTELITLKNQLMEKEFTKLGMTLHRSSGGRQFTINSSEYGAGRAAGENVAIGGKHVGSRTLRITG